MAVKFSQRVRLLLIAACLLNVTACLPLSPEPLSSPTPSAWAAGATATLAPPAPAAPTPTNAPPPTLWLAPELPAAFVRQLNLPKELQQVDRPENASLRLEIGSQHPVSRWIYALAAPFPTLTDAVPEDSIQRFWQAGSAPGFPAARLLLSPQTQKLFSRLWGVPLAAVQELPEDQLLDAAWAAGDAWALVPFEALEPRWKVIEVGGQSPIRKDFDPAHYPLTIPISLDGASPTDEAVRSQYGPGSPKAIAPAGNRDPQRMTTVVLTGVTALVRATAVMMELKGMTYPGEDIRDWVRQADIAHVSNEIPFTPKCPQPGERRSNLVFCSKPKYIELLEDIGADVVELTGDHFQDWGPEAMLYTLDLYKERGFSYYGGGADLEEARSPLLLENNGNKIAFLGCNGKAPGYATAGADTPGAYHCDMQWMAAKIQELRGAGYLPIVTFQHEEIWSYAASPALQPDFRAAAEAGAVIVSGSQAHQPQAIEFDGPTLIHYGLGNLFFDQFYEGLPYRQAFIDRHVFYDGRYVSTELLSMMFIDYARPRPMTPDERQDLLKTIFTVSGWMVN